MRSVFVQNQEIIILVVFLDILCQHAKENIPSRLVEKSGLISRKSVIYPKFAIQIIGGPRVGYFDIYRIKNAVGDN